MPEVASATEVPSPATGQPLCSCGHLINAKDFSVQLLPVGKPFSKLLSGRLPDSSSPDQVLASFTEQRDYDVQIGTVIRVPFYAASQFSAYFNATGTPPTPSGPTVAFHVVGIEASEGEFPAGQTPSYTLYPGQGFARTVAPRTANYHVYLLRLRHGAADLARFGDDVNALSGASSAGFQGVDQLNASVEASIHPQAIGWWVLAALAALVGLLVIGQALARQSVVESGDYPTLATLGLEQRQLAMLATARNLVVAIVGAAGAAALAIAIALSPIAPVGEARIAEPSTGVTFDPLVLLVGLLAVVVVVLALGIWPSLREGRTLSAEDEPLGSRPSAVVAQLAAAGAPPSAVIGVRHALQRGRGRSTVPVGTALIGTVLAVTALCGTAVFGAGLSHLTATPNLYGDPFQLNFSTCLGASPTRHC